MSARTLSRRPVRGPARMRGEHRPRSAYNVMHKIARSHHAAHGSPGIVIAPPAVWAMNARMMSWRRERARRNRIKRAMRVVRECVAGLARIREQHVARGGAL